MRICWAAFWGAFHDIQFHDATGNVIFRPLADRMVIEKMLVATGVLICIEGLLLGLSRVMVEAGEPLELAGANEDDQVS